MRWIVSHHIRTDALLTHVKELEHWQQTTRRQAVVNNEPTGAPGPLLIPQLSHGPGISTMPRKDAPETAGVGVRFGCGVRLGL